MIPVEENKLYEVTIEAMSSDGCGIARPEGFAVFVPYTLTGDRVLVRIIKLQKTFARASLVEILSSSPNRLKPKCSVYTECGGCQLCHAEYETQLEIKREVINSAMRRIGGFKDFETDTVVGMEIPERYRNKMVFTVGKSNSGTVCGFNAPRTHTVIPVTDCMLGDELCGAVNSAVLEYMRENNLHAYDEDTGKGSVRQVFIRKSFSEDKLMVVVISRCELKNGAALAEKIRGVSERIVSVVLNISEGRAVMGNKNITLWGDDRLEDTLCGVKFLISPHSFFQVNPVQTERLYTYALSMAQLDKSMSLMDIYCGIGTISLCAARRVKNVIGIEAVKQAVNDARENAAVNGIANAQFYADKAENIVPKLIAQGQRPEVVILDPPRSGSDEATLGAICEAAPQRVVYVSCNSATLARDARFLAESGYTLVSARGFDMFPHTAHVETVAVLEK